MLEIGKLPAPADSSPGESDSDYPCRPGKSEIRSSLLRRAWRLNFSSRALQAVVVFFGIVFSVTGGDLSLEVTPQPVIVGEPAQLRLISNQSYPQIQELPELPGIIWISGISHSMETSIINFKRTTKYVTIYPFRIRQEGKIQIPAMKVFLNRKKVLTDSLEINAFTRKFAINNGNKNGKPVELEDILFMRTFLLSDRTEFYVGEEIPFEIRVYSISGLGVEYHWPEINIENVIFRDYSSVNPENGRFASSYQNTEKINGQTFNIIVFRTAFRAISPGTLSGTISENCIIQVPREGARRPRSLFSMDDPFDDNFFSDPFKDSFFSDPFSRYNKTEYNLNSKLSEILINPLPSVSGSAIFLGLTGNWEIKSDISSNNLKVGEPITFRIKVEGEGSLDTLKAPELRISGFRVYPPEIVCGKLSAATDGKENAEIRYVLIPLQQGTAEVSLAVSYFSPLKKKYMEYPFQHKFRVEKSEGTVNAVVADSNNPKTDSGVSSRMKRVEKEPDGILYLKKDISENVGIPLWRNHVSLMVFFLVFGTVAWLISELIFYRRIKFGRNPVLRRKIEARRRRGKILRMVRRSTPEDIHDVIRNEVAPYLNDLFALSPGTSAVELAEQIKDEDIAVCLREGTTSAYMPGASGKVSADLKNRLLRALKRCALFLLTVYLSFSGIAEEGLKQDFDEFNPLTAYDKGDFEQAASYYKKKLDLSASDPALLYNLGNCYYQLGDFAGALVSYERARRLAPRDSDIRENLNHVRRKLMLPEIGGSENPVELLISCRDSVRPDEWLLMAAFTWMLIGIMFAFRRQFISGKWMFASVILSLVFLLNIVAYFFQVGLTYSAKSAVVLQKNIPVYTLPSQNSRIAELRLNPGEELCIEEERHDWMRIRTGAAEGWVRSDAVSRLWPY